MEINQTPVESTAPVTDTTPAAPAEVAPKEEPKLAKAFAQLSQREKQLLKREEEFKSREKAMLEKYKPFEEEDQLWKDRKVLDVFKRKGMSFDDIAKIVINDGKVPPDMELRTVKEQLEALKADLSKEKEEAAAAAERAKAGENEKLLVNFKTEIGKTLEAQPERFELLSVIPNKVELVYGKIDEIFQKTQAEGEPKILTNEEAADLLEKELQDEIVSKYLPLKKIQSMFKPSTAAEPEPVKFKVPNTLSNAMSAAPTPSAPRAKTREESLAEASKLLRFMKE